MGAEWRASVGRRGYGSECERQEGQAAYHPPPVFLQRSNTQQLTITTLFPVTLALVSSSRAVSAPARRAPSGRDAAGGLAGAPKHAPHCRAQRTSTPFGPPSVSAVGTTRAMHPMFCCAPAAAGVEITGWAPSTEHGLSRRTLKKTRTQYAS